MPTGKIKWFNPDKGFGFIEQDNKEKDVFVHWTSVEGLGNYERMRDGEPVSYETENTPRGLKAQNVVRLEHEEAY
jgi:CspA family cold shock protein